LVQQLGVDAVVLQRLDAGGEFNQLAGAASGSA
jgi:hypothetical protein